MACLELDMVEGRGRADLLLLIVEDNPLIGFMLEDVLAGAGHRVAGPVATLDEAVSSAERQHPDLALVDIDLQGQGTGVDLARLLKERMQVPTVFVSGQVLVARAHQDVAVGLLKKPFSPDSLVASVALIERRLAGEADGRPPAELELFDGLAHGGH